VRPDKVGVNAGAQRTNKEEVQEFKVQKSKGKERIKITPREARGKRRVPRASRVKRPRAENAVAAKLGRSIAAPLQRKRPGAAPLTQPPEV
jgi:hypothetical protein